MHINDIFENGHNRVMNTIEGISNQQAENPTVCGVWSVKDIMIHLMVIEQALGDLLASLQGKAKDTLLLHDMIYDPNFNDRKVRENQYKSFPMIVKEYELAHERAARLLRTFPDDLRLMAGVIGWYGDLYDLDDFIAYTYYGHKIEHCAQIAIFIGDIARTDLFEAQSA